MTLKDLIIAVILMLVCLLGFKPALNNFKAVWNTKHHPRVSPLYRKFVLFWLGLGVVSLVFLFIVIGLSLVVKLGFVLDFE